MVQLPSLFWIIVSTHIIHTMAGSCFSLPRDPNDIQSYDSSKWSKCKNRPAKGVPWACQDPNIDFPTVACLLADMRTCGNVGVNTVFYSFGVATPQARQFRDTLNPRGIMFNDALDTDYGDEVLKPREDEFRLEFRERQKVYAARYDEALAMATTGEAFVVVLHYNGQEGGEGAYQSPLNDGEINNWRAYEFPSLQRNPAITQVTSVDASNNFHQTVDWVPGDGRQIMLASTASNQIPPNPANLAQAPCLAKFKRDSGPCTPCSDSSTTPPSSTITPAPTMSAPSCVLHEQDPDQGINQAFCLCDRSVTLTPLSVPLSGHQSDSCAYKSMPATGTVSISTQETVYTSNCKVCTQIQLNAPTCTSKVQGCTPTAPATPASTFVVNLSNNTVHVGDVNKLNGGKDLRDNMMAKLKSLCPDPAPGNSGQCDTSSKPEIDGISTVIPDKASGDGVDTKGKLVFQFQDSSYASTHERDRMLAAAVGAFQQSAAQSCKEVDYAYSVDQHTTTGCGTPPGKRSPVSGVLPDLICHAKMTVCNGPDHINVELANASSPYANHLDFEMKFDMDGNSVFTEFMCDLIIEGLEALVAAVAPELAPEELITTEELLTLCADIINS